MSDEPNALIPLLILKWWRELLETDPDALAALLEQRIKWCEAHKAKIDGTTPNNGD